MPIKELIERTLLAARPTDGMRSLLTYMDVNGYYSCSGSSHNAWKGGAAEHMWACYRIACEKKEEILRDKPHLLKYAADEKLAVVCLLHDLCDMKHITVVVNGDDVSHRHGRKSKGIMVNYGVGSPAEQDAVCCHMHAEITTKLKDKISKEECEALHTVLYSADHKAAGTAWNSELFKEGRTQHHMALAGGGYLRSVALDRTAQCLDNHIYLDCEWREHVLKGYNRDNIVWNAADEMGAATLIEESSLTNDCDVITELHGKVSESKDYCLVLGITSEIPEDANKRLLCKRKQEQSFLICSNVLYSFYKRVRVKTQMRHHYGFSMTFEAKGHYRQLEKGKVIRLDDVTFFRDGENEGFRMVAPWKCDVILVPGVSGAAIVKNSNLEQI